MEGREAYKEKRKRGKEEQGAGMLEARNKGHSSESIEVSISVS
jgi:hypothetical protein